MAGSVTADGVGNISGGEEDYVDPTFNNLAASMLGTYTVGSDGRGTMSLTCQPILARQTFSFAVTSANHAQLIEFDDFALSSGTLDLQDPTTFAGSFRPRLFFTTSGVDTVAVTSRLVGGVLTADGAGNLVLPAALSTSTRAVPLTAMTSHLPGRTRGGRWQRSRNHRSWVDSQTFSFYMVGAEVLENGRNRRVRFSRRVGLGSGAAPSAGYDVTALTGTFRIQSKRAQADLGPVGVAGQFTADGAGNVTGFADANEGGLLSSGAVAGTYAVPDSTMPRVVVTLAPGTGSTFTTDVSNVIVYLTDPALNVLDPTNPIVGAGAIAMEADATANGVGYVIEQSPATQSGNYAVSAQTNALSAESDLVGQGLSDGSANIAGNADQDVLGTTTSDAPLALTFAADPNNPGRFTGTLRIQRRNAGGHRLLSGQQHAARRDRIRYNYERRLCGLSAYSVTFNREGHGRATGRARSHSSLFTASAHLRDSCVCTCPVPPASLPAVLNFFD